MTRVPCNFLFKNFNVPIIANSNGFGVRNNPILVNLWSHSDLIENVVISLHSY